MRKRITITFDYTLPENELTPLQIDAAKRAIEFMLLRFEQNAKAVLEFHHSLDVGWNEKHETLDNLDKPEYIVVTDSET